MPVTVTSVESGYAGNKRVNRGRLALDNNYPGTPGYPISARQFGLAVIEFLDAVPPVGYVLDWDPVNATLRVFESSGLTIRGSQAIGDVVQVSGGVIGKTTVGDVTTTPQEAAAGTDLSAITGVPWRAEGV